MCISPAQGGSLLGRATIALGALAPVHCEISTIVLPFQKGGPAIAAYTRRVFAALLFAFVVGATTPSDALAASSPLPRDGGTVTTTGENLSVLDPVSTGSSTANDGLVTEVLGSLFLPASTGTGAPVGDLATGFRFIHQGMAVNVTLRRGVHFSDGTPLNPRAVIWNLRRASTSGTPESALLSSVTNFAQTGPEAVTVSFSTPDYGFITSCVTSTICDMGSPTSFSRLGAAGYAATPVGAGPFKIVAAEQARLELVRNPTYWDARHVYLARWDVIDVGSDPYAAYQALIQDTVQGAAFDGIATPSSLLFQAVTNHNVISRATPNLDYGFLPLNASKAPFSDQRAREALDFCTDRTAIANGVASGYATPAYVLAGASSAYLPRPGGIRGAETLMPYRYDVSQSSALVAQLGGLSFQLDVASGESEAVADALATEWLACGIHAQVVDSTEPQLDASVSTGVYDAAYLTAPGAASPSSSMVEEWPASPLSVPGLADPRLTGLAQSAASTASSSRLATLWHQIWFQENTDAIDLPVISSGITVVVSHCLRDFSYEFGISLIHAWLACRV